MALCRHPVISALMAQAVELGHSRLLAIELYKYLSLRLHAPPEVQLSPSTTIDELWHWLLLNTELADAMYALLGGRVSHSTSSSGDVCYMKMLRRIRAMNMLQQDGASPVEEFWKEPGLVPCKVPVPDGDGAFIYAYKDAAGKVVVRADRNPLLNFVATISAEMGYAGGNTDDDDTDADAPLRMPEVILQTMTGKRTPVRVPLSCTARELKTAVQDRIGLPPDQQRFVFNGSQLPDSAVLSSVGIVDGSTVHLVLRMAGC